MQKKITVADIVTKIRAQVDVVLGELKLDVEAAEKVRKAINVNVGDTVNVNIENTEADSE